jgi:hypothetical protein
MTHADQVAPDLVRAISTATGLSLNLDRVVSTRRGATVTKLRGGEQAYALKLVHTKEAPSSGAYNASELLLREADNMRALDHFTGHSYVGDGQYNDYLWLMTRWREAKSSPVIARAAKRHSSSKERQQKLLGIFRQILVKTLALHNWVAQFIAVCRRSKMVSMSTRSHRRGSRLCRR